MNKKPLYGCVLCGDCSKKINPKSIGTLTSTDMTILGYSGCPVDGNTYLVNADRKCLNYKAKQEGK
jgi:hypothetical protein